MSDTGAAYAPARQCKPAADARGAAERRDALVVALGALALWLLLAVPGHPNEATLGALLRPPLELPLLLLGACLLPVHAVRTGRALRALVVAALAVGALLRFADLGTRLAFDRRFSPLTELHLVRHGWTLASDSIGPGTALCVALCAALVLALLCVAAWRGLERIARLTRTARRALGAGSAAALAAGLALASLHGATGLGPGVRPPLAQDLIERAGSAGRAVEDQRRFAEALDIDPLGPPAPAPRFGALAGLDVVIILIESYGRSWLDAPGLAEGARARLGSVDEALDGAGFAASSGWLASPVRGGRSWLAQATFASGLDVTNHARFDRLIVSDRVPLQGLLGDAGWSTATLLPAARETWVEGAWYDVDRFFGAYDLGYAGRDFGWVTMPDQYVLSAFQHRVRESAPEPLAATIALIGSHAPWTPLALPVDWETIGDGAVFDGSRRFGGPLDWRNPEPVRRMYAASLDHSLRMIGEYIVRHGENALFIVAGDHQPATVIAGWSSNSDVPVHVIASDPALLDRLPAEHFGPGMVPADGAPALPMSAMRELLGTAFEREADAAAPVVRP